MKMIDEKAIIIGVMMVCWILVSLIYLNVILMKKKLDNELEECFGKEFLEKLKEGTNHED